jgi:hypothetical protein
MSEVAEGTEAVAGQIRARVSLPRLADLAAQRERVGQLLGRTVLPFSLVLYLALEGGGYDVLVRSEVGIAIWWIVLLGALVGVLPLQRLGRAELLGLGLLLAFAAWTALGITWSGSSERSVDEVSRVLVLLGALTLTLSVQDRGALPGTVRAIASAIGLVGALALLSRLEPSWFPTVESLPGVEARLAYPVNYWNALAALMAIGFPLVLAIAADSRRALTQAVATASLPIMGLTAYYTLSRGGVIEIAIALIVLLALYPRRLELLPSVGLGLAGTGLAVAAASQRRDLADNLKNATAASQGHEMIVVVLVVCAGVALLRYAVELARREGLWPDLRLPRRPSLTVIAGLAAVAVVLALVAGAPGLVSREWSNFKSPVGPASNGSTQRFTSASGNGRYQYWSSALDAFESRPLTGIGPGTWEFWWAQHGSIPGFVRNAHSLYLETLAELGVPGLALVLVLLGAVFVTGGRQMRRSDASERAMLAAALAAAAGFVTAAASDWVWQMTVVPVAFLLLAAAVLRGSEGRGFTGWLGRLRNQRAALAAVSVCALVAIGIPMLAINDVRKSQEDVRSGHLDSAISDADSAASLMSFAATPNLQRALVFEAQGNLGAAAQSATEAAQQESTNWRTWLTLSRIDWEDGRAKPAVAAYRRARTLNPHSPLFQTGNGGAQ